MEWVFAQIEPLLKRSPVIFLALVVFFYCPDHLVGPEIVAVRQDYAGVIFLVICLTGASTVFRICRAVFEKYSSWRNDRDMTWFDDLSAEEQGLLAGMYLSGKPTGLVVAEAPEVQKLIAFRYLLRCGAPTTNSYGELLVPVTLSPSCSDRFGHNRAKLKKYLEDAVDGND